MTQAELEAVLGCLTANGQRESAEAIRERLSFLVEMYWPFVNQMYVYDPHPRASDYKCELCGNRPRDDSPRSSDGRAVIIHAINCDGIRYLELVKGLIFVPAISDTDPKPRSRWEVLDE